MPIYEYRCEKCNELFSVSMRMSELDAAKVECPKCEGTDISREYSVFYARTSKKS